MRLLQVVALVVGLIWMSSVHADDKPTPEQAIHATIESYVEAFNQGNASAIADHWDNKAEYILPSGERVQGRDAIREYFTKFFAAGDRPKIALIAANVKLVSDTVAIEEGQVRLNYASGAHEDCGYIAVHNLTDKGWKLHTVRELAASTSAASEETTHPLQDLAWLIGNWTQKSEHGDMRLSFNWAKNDSFITGTFHVPLPDGKVLEGTQVIGWDPEAKVIRSWVFDSQGGFGEGLWTRGNKHWSVKFVQVLADGRRGTSTNVYDIVDDNTFAWKTIGRKIDGAYAPNIGPITAVRLHD